MACAQPDARRGQGKKLTAIARAIYARNQQKPGDGKDDLRHVPERIRERIERERAATDVDVWPEHVRALELFSRCDTLWRVAPMGGVLGLDYSGVEALMRMAGIDAISRLSLLDELRVMEAEATGIINQRGGGA